MFKRISLAAFSLVLIAALVGCQNAPSDDTSSSKTDDDTSSSQIGDTSSSKDNSLPIEFLPYVITEKDGNVISESFEWGVSLEEVMKAKGWSEENIVEEASDKLLNGTIPFQYPPGNVSASYIFVDNKLWGSRYYYEFKTEEEYNMALEILAKQADTYLPKPVSMDTDPIRNKSDARWFDTTKGYVDFSTGNSEGNFTINLKVCSPVISPTYAAGFMGSSEATSSSAAQ